MLVRTDAFTKYLTEYMKHNLLSTKYTYKYQEILCFYQNHSVHSIISVIIKILTLLQLNYQQ